jgi:hypothetical protein
MSSRSRSWPLVVTLFAEQFFFQSFFINQSSIQSTIDSPGLPDDINSHVEIRL